jgi:hypothetical protein
MKKFVLVLVVIMFIASMLLCRCTVVSNRPEPTPIPCISVNPESFPDGGYSKTITGTGTCVNFQGEVSFSLANDSQWGYTPVISESTVPLSLDLETGDCWSSTLYKYCTSVDGNKLTVTVIKN